MGQRYLSLNLTNCGGDGIQTVEIRLGQSTFDVNYINKYIYLLQCLFEFSFAMEQRDYNNNLSYPNQTVDSILLYAQANQIIPNYCFQSTAQYNNTPDDYNLPISAANLGRPISGFFISEGNMETRSKIIYKSLQLFYCLTRVRNVLTTMIDYINFYNTLTNDDGRWSSRPYLYHIPDNILDYSDVNYFNPDEIATWNSYWFDTTNSYKIRPDRLPYQLDHECRTCSQAANGSCKQDFNEGGAYPTLMNNRGQTSYRDESRVYSIDYGNNERYHTKTQTELINYKTGNGNGGHGYIQGHYHNPPQGGGIRKMSKTFKRISYGGNVSRSSKTSKNTSNIHSMIRSSNTTKLNSMKIGNKAKKSHTVKNMNSKFVEPHSLRNKKTNKSNVMTKMTPEMIQRDLESDYKINKGDRIIVHKNNSGEYIASYIDWVGGHLFNKEMSSYITALMNANVIDKSILDILVEHRYIEPSVYLIETDIHLRKLKEGLSTLKINEETIHKIRKVYRAHSIIYDSNQRRK
jgi:hypothetical protein